MPTTDKTQFALDAMVTGATKRKEAVALTPVGVEPGGPLAGHHEVEFPYDDPQTTIAAVRTGLKLCSDLRLELDHVARGLIALAALYGADEDAVKPQARLSIRPTPEDRPVDPAQQKFAEDFEAKTHAAQAQAFAERNTVDVVPPWADGDPEKAKAILMEAAFGHNDAPVAWVCPQHGDATIEVLTSRRGRMYRACKTCHQFDKGE